MPDPYRPRPGNRGGSILPSVYTSPSNCEGACIYRRQNAPSPLRLARVIRIWLRWGDQNGDLSEMAFHEKGGPRQVDFDLPFLKFPFPSWREGVQSGPERSRARSVRRSEPLTASMAYYGSDGVRGSSQWQYRGASAMDRAQLCIYDGLCNGESAGCPSDSRRLRIWINLDFALGDPFAH
jgi:hypothetical protein